MALHMDRMFELSKRAIDKATETLWPHRSIITGQPSGGRACLTPDDFKQLHFIAGPVCDVCGVPQISYIERCAACIGKSPKWRKARAALVYDDHSARPILALKRAGRRDGLAVMANWMKRAARDCLSDADLVTAVPLHRSRLAERGYNQAVWLAAALSRVSNVPFHAALVQRTKNTPSQGGLSARARKRNVSGAFHVHEKYKYQVIGKRLVLVDDVLTTGATVQACVSTLLNAGAISVDVVTVARVVREQDMTI